MLQASVNHRSALKVAEAEQCLSALRDAACAACRQGAAEVASAGLSAAVMARISGLEADVHHVTRISSEARQAKASAIDKRMKVLIIFNIACCTACIDIDTGAFMITLASCMVPVGAGDTGKEGSARRLAAT